MREDYRERLREAIFAEHECHSIHSATAHVLAAGEERTVWEGDVEVFDVDHPKAKKCYAWGDMEGGKFRATCILEIAPVESPATAVEFALGGKRRE